MIGGVIVNGIIQKEQIGQDSPDFVKQRVQMQKEYLSEIRIIFNDQVRALIPLFETEVKGAPMLNRMMHYLFE